MSETDREDANRWRSMPEELMATWLAYMRYLPDQPVTAEDLGMPEVAAGVEVTLREHLPEILAAIDTRTMLAARPSKDIQGIADHYRLTPIPGKLYSGRSITASQFAQPIDSTVTTTFYAGLPFIGLDAGFGVGLVYRDRLAAVGAAGVDDRGFIVIRQLQDVTSVRRLDDAGRSNKEYYKTGLQQGVLWRQSLVTTWEDIARQVGAPGIAIQSHTESSYEIVRMYGKAGLDDVADAAGFAFNETTRNWEKPIQTSA